MLNQFIINVQAMNTNNVEVSLSVWYKRLKNLTQSDEYEYEEYMDMGM